MENYHATGCQKKAGKAVLLSEKLDFKLKAITRDEEGHYIIITWTIHQEELTIKRLCAKYGSPQMYKTINHKHKQPY